MIPRRLLRPLAIVGVLALGAATTGCSSTMNDAATITYKDKSGTHTVHVTRDEFESELRAASSQKVISLLGSEFKGDGKSTTDSRWTAEWLGILIREKLSDALFADQKLKVSNFDTASAAAFEAGNLVPSSSQNDNSQFSEALYNALPKSLQRSMEKHAARTLTLVRATCHSGKAIGGILVGSMAQANAIISAINSAADKTTAFQTLVQTKSLDPETKRSNGLLGCFDANDFSNGAALDQVPPYKAVGPFPISQQNGKSNYAVFVLVPWDASEPDTFASANKSVTQERSDIEELLLRASVHIDPRYGTWQSGVSASGPYSIVVPPDVPNPRDCRETTCPTTTTTTTIPLSGG
jgi:hypothetical protein